MLRELLMAAASIRPDLVEGGLIRQLVVQTQGVERAEQQGIAIAREMVQKLAAHPRTEVPDAFSHMIIGVMNGSSDATSGIFTNRAVGYFCDFAMATGRVAFSQTLETLGAEERLFQRADEQMRVPLANLLSAVGALHEVTERAGKQSEPTDGNVKGGLSSLAEKSVGTVGKFGHDVAHRLRAIVHHGSLIPETRAGLCLVDGPGQDILCLTGLVAAGCQIVLFTTGRGTPTGSPVAPTLKITSNIETAELMRDEIDVALSRHLLFEVDENGSLRATLEELAQNQILPAVRQAFSGELTSAERRRQCDFQVRQYWPIE